MVVRVTHSGGALLYRRTESEAWLDTTGLRLIQEGLRGVVRIPGGTGNALNRSDFPIQVMGKTGTTSEFRDALFVGSTYGLDGITIAVRIGFDDARTLGSGETGGCTALPVFREIMARVYANGLAGASGYYGTLSIQLSPVYMRIGRPAVSTNRTTSPTTPPPVSAV